MPLSDDPKIVVTRVFSRERPHEVPINLVDRPPQDEELDQLLDCFRSQYARLKETNGRDHKRAACMLCRLSRLIRLRLGLSLDVPVGPARAAVELFRAACQHMRVDPNDPEFAEFYRNIQARSDLIDEKLRLRVVRL